MLFLIQFIVFDFQVKGRVPKCYGKNHTYCISAMGYDYDGCGRPPRSILHEFLVYINLSPTYKRALVMCCGTGVIYKTWLLCPYLMMDL